MYYEHTWRVVIRRTEDRKGWVARVLIASHRVPETSDELKDTDNLVTEREELVYDADKARLTDRAFSLLKLLTNAMEFTTANRERRTPSI